MLERKQRPSSTSLLLTDVGAYWCESFGDSVFSVSKLSKKIPICTRFARRVRFSVRSRTTFCLPPVFRSTIASLRSAKTIVSLTERKDTANKRSISKKFKLGELVLEESNTTNSGSDHGLFSETDTEV